MSFLNDIKKQPQHVREIMFGLAVFITVLLIGMVWFRSFQTNLYVLMNPEEGAEKALARQNFPSENLGGLAVENAPVPSLFGFIWQSAGEIKGLVSNLLNRQPTTDNQRQEKAEVESGNVYTLPLSDYK